MRSRHGSQSDSQGSIPYVHYFDDWKDETVACRGCGWNGRGADTTQGEVFKELVERDCPRCHDRIMVLMFPTASEIREAASRGNMTATEMLATVEPQQAGHARWEAQHLTSDRELPDVDADVITAALSVSEPEHRLALSVNGRIVYSELAFFETLEPLRRLLPILRSKYGARLKSIDLTGANLYLYGDDLSLLDAGAKILAQFGFDRQGQSSI